METPARKTLLVVSHPAVIETNQAVFALLRRQGVDVHLITPSRWRHAYNPSAFVPETAADLIGFHTLLPVWGMGKPQRHRYRSGVGAVLDRVKPDVVYLEEECFSLSADQWSRACRRRGIPFGVQAWENLDRPLPWPIKRLRSTILHTADFVLARTPAAAHMVAEWGAGGRIEIVPSPVPSPFSGERPDHEGFVVGGAGRLVEQKGFLEVAAVVASIDGAEFVVAGDGPLREELQRNGVRVVTDATHATMPEFFSSLDALVLWSRSTPTWAEQFGRVLVEALAQETPVIGSSCGEIPWVIATTAGGIVVPEGDREALRVALVELRDDPSRRTSLGRAGRSAVEEQFSLTAAASGLRRVAGIET
ncbi:MAG: glycosyltransferase family 4 protein [Actinomycetota bacterium]